jgi:two-component system nitrate/nitrite response regulator NarL
MTTPQRGTLAPMSNAPIRLMVVDDHTLFRRGLRALLAADGRFEVVAEAGDAAEALSTVARVRPEIMLLDNHLPGASGVATLPALLAAAPGLRVLMLTMSEDERDLGAALAAGAAGYLLKTSESEELGEAIVRAFAGQPSMSPAMAAKLGAAFRAAGTPGTAAVQAPVAVADPLAELSARERDTVQLIALGHSNKQIARELGIAETTVKIHVQHALRKLGLESRVQVAALVAALGARAPDAESSRSDG